MITLHIEDHSPSAPHDSDAWAVTARGWIWAARGDEDAVCLGHYLDYQRAEAKPIHVVSCVTRESCYVATPAEANAWILDRAEGKIAAHCASDLLRRGGYQHEADEVARLTVHGEVQLSLVVS